MEGKEMAQSHAVETVFVPHTRVITKCNMKQVINNL